MSNTYTWTIDAVDAYSSAQGQTNLVYNAHWRVTATSPTTYTNQQGQVVPYTSQVYAVQPIVYNPNNAFIPSASLTQAEVAGWVQAAMGATAVAALEAALDAQIALQINPTTVTLQLSS
jgi:hypothetical protein